MAKVGFVGLGIMGEPMCRNLLAKGHAVAIFYVCIALAGIGWTVAHVHSDAIQHIAGGLRTALVGR